MSQLFASFPQPKKEDWVQLLRKELKGESIDTLQKINKIEEIAFPSYFHSDDQTGVFADPGKLPYTRGIQHQSNDWNIATPFRIDNNEVTNTSILAALMSGTTALILHAENEEEINFNVLLNEVGLEYIHTTFHAKTLAQAQAFVSFIGNNPGSIICSFQDELIPLITQSTNSKLKYLSVNAYEVQSAGGTTWQELAIALAEGHDLLVAQLEAGIVIDDAAANIHFVFGIGNKYFFEVCKFRAFRTAWSTIIGQYEPQHDCSHAATITAQTGFLTTSLKDPYTNLLRQTTEAMSAVIGGVQQIAVYNYDWFAQSQNTEFTRRMATNISLLLKEESYMDKVIDPVGGSYALDNLTTAIAERAWTTFRQIERDGGLREPQVITALKSEISFKANQRVTAVQEKSEKLIGINVFPNPDTIDNDWTVLPAAWKGLPTLILEQTL